MHEPRARATVRDRHLHRVDHEGGPQVRRHRPADDPSAEQIFDRRQVQPALARRDRDDVGDPDPIGRGRVEASCHPIRGRPEPTRSLAPATPADVDALDPGGAHQPSDALAVHPHSFRAQFRRDPGSAVGATRGLVDLPDPPRECPVVHDAPRWRASRPVVERRGGDPEMTTQHLGSERGPLRGDEPVDAHPVSLSLAK